MVAGGGGGVTRRKTSDRVARVAQNGISPSVPALLRIGDRTEKRDPVWKGTVCCLVDGVGASLEVGSAINDGIFTSGARLPGRPRQ